MLRIVSLNFLLLVYFLVSVTLILWIMWWLKDIKFYDFFTARFTFYDFIVH
jgi:hypothetical protein